MIKDEDIPSLKGNKRADKGLAALAIHPLPTRKDKIKQPTLAEANIIPRVNSSVLMVGASGSGKTTLLANLLTKKEFLGKAFDRVILISPTGKSDDIQKYLELPEEDIWSDMNEAADLLQPIMDEQDEIISEDGADKAPLIAIIFEDVIGDRELMKSPQFIKSFVANRHYNFTTFICSQSYTAVPRKCRMQAKNIFYFRGSNSETEKITEEYSPPGFSKKEFIQIIDYCTDEMKYDFLYINKNVPFAERYRKNLDVIIDLEATKGSGEGTLTKEEDETVDIKKEEETKTKKPKIKRQKKDVTFQSPDNLKRTKHDS